MSNKPANYPWALLYNLESQLGQQPLPRMRRVGRPSRPIPRTRVMLLLTADERRMLQRLTNIVGEKLYPAKISRSQVVGLALRLLGLKLDGKELPGEVVDWPTLITALAGEEEG